jgi:iron complex outermembrane receptor protein
VGLVLALLDSPLLTTTVSAFQITQPSTITDTATNALVLVGQQRNQGIEINVFGEVTEGIRLLGDAMFIDAVLTQTQNGSTNGWQALGVPNVQFNLAGEWDTPFAKGLTLNGRIVYTAHNTSTCRTRVVPSRTGRASMSVRATLSKG